MSSLCHERSFEPGELIYDAESDEQSLYLIVEGEATLTSNDGTETKFEAGRTFGELGLLDQGVRRAKATANTTTRTLVIEPTDFDQLVACDTAIGVVLLRNLARGMAARVRKQG